MAKHVPLGEPTINDHEQRIENLERGLDEHIQKLEAHGWVKADQLADAKADYATEMTGVIEGALPATPKKKKDKVD